MLYFLKHGAYQQSKSTVVHYTCTCSNQLISIILHDFLVVKNNSGKTSTCTHSNLKFFRSKICLEMFQQCFICHLIVMENSKLTADRRRTKHLSSSQTAVAKEKGFSLPRIQRYTCTCNCTACEHQFALDNEKLLSDFIQLARSFRAWGNAKILSSRQCKLLTFCAVDSSLRSLGRLVPSQVIYQAHAETSM